MDEKKRELSTTDGLVQLMYYLSTTMDLIVEQADREIRRKTSNYAHFARELKHNFKELARTLERYAYYSDRIDEEAFKAGDAVSTHESRLEGANEIVRLLLLYYDRAGNNEDNANKVIAFLKDLPSSGIFDNEYIRKFRMK